jgi:zinc transport system substrate-binding protein
MTLPLRHLAPALCVALTLSACGDGSGGAQPGVAAPDGSPDRLRLVASFYPLEYLTERVAGEHAEVVTLTSPGVDPHDLELTPRTVGSMGSADLVVYQAGMQPAVDDAVAQQAEDHAFDVTASADLLALGESDDEHAGHEPHDGHDHGPEDPHFWLDPVRYGEVARALAEELGVLDPRHAEDYASSAEAVVDDLEALDEDFRSGLASCGSRDLVTTHEAFGYLAHRYDLHQTGITGLSPDSEPSPARLAEVTAQVRDLGVRAVYAEPIVTDAMARTVAQETGAEVLVLDPVEGITDASAGTDYLEVMRANLTSLRQGQGCT